MERRAVRGVPRRVAINRQALHMTAKTSQNTSDKGNAEVKETLRRLKLDVDNLQRKLAFLNKIDLTLLSDETGAGDVTFIVNNDNIIKAHRFMLVSFYTPLERAFRYYNVWSLGWKENFVRSQDIWFK
jgi:hypothetical protein